MSSRWCRHDAYTDSRYASTREPVITAVESDAVKGVLKAFRAPLEKQFNAIAKRKTKILAAKAATGAATRADGTALNEPLTVTIEDFCKDLERQKLFCDLKELVLDPIRGNPDINTTYETYAFKELVAHDIDGRRNRTVEPKLT